jgi:hypothetical protein
MPYKTKTWIITFPFTEMFSQSHSLQEFSIKIYDLKEWIVKTNDIVFFIFYELAITKRNEINKLF